MQASPGLMSWSEMAQLPTGTATGNPIFFKLARAHRSADILLSTPVCMPSTRMMSRPHPPHACDIAEPSALKGWLALSYIVAL